MAPSALQSFEKKKWGFWCRQPTGLGDNEIWRIATLNGILYLPDVDSKTTSFLLCLRWYFRFKLSYRDLVAILGERGLSISHTTILRWVVRYGDTREKRWRHLYRIPSHTDWGKNPHTTSRGVHL